MEIVLLQDVEQLGTAGSVVTVQPGFARNFLIPRGLAAPASAQQLKAVEEQARQRARRMKREKERAGVLKRKLEGRSLTLTLALGEHDKAFGAITTHDITEALRQDGIELDRRALVLEEPLKTLGIYEIPVRLHPEITASLKLWIVKA